MFEGSIYEDEGQILILPMISHSIIGMGGFFLLICFIKDVGLVTTRLNKT